MSNSGDRPRKLKKRRAKATVGGTTQSGFANRSMSDLMKPGGSASDRKESGKKKPPQDPDA